MKYSKQEICSLIQGKTVAEMQRIVKQYDFKFHIDVYDGKRSDPSKTNKNKTVHLEIVNNIITKAT